MIFLVRFWVKPKMNSGNNEKSTSQVRPGLQGQFISVRKCSSGRFCQHCCKKGNNTAKINERWIINPVAHATGYKNITPKGVFGYRKDQNFVLTGRFARWSNWLDSFRCVIESRQRNSFMTAYYVRYFRPSKLMVYGDAWRPLKK